MGGGTAAVRGWCVALGQVVRRDTLCSPPRSARLPFQPLVLSRVDARQGAGKQQGAVGVLFGRRVVVERRCARELEHQRWVFAPPAEAGGPRAPLSSLTHATSRSFPQLPRSVTRARARRPRAVRGLRARPLAQANVRPRSLPPVAGPTRAGVECSVVRPVRPAGLAVAVAVAAAVVAQAVPLRRSRLPHPPTATHQG